MCPVPRDIACFAAERRLRSWCADLARWGRVIMARSRLAAAPGPVVAQWKAAAGQCPHAVGDWPECGCADRYCSRWAKIVGGLDCLACVAGWGDAP